MRTIFFNKSLLSNLSRAPLISPSRRIVLFRSQAYSTKTVFDKQSIQFLSKHLKQALQKKDVVFYQAPPGVKRTFNWMYISAGVQLMFCDTEDAPVVLAPQGKRIAIAGGLVGIGVAIATVMCLYPWR
ncbi:hypothetical protein BCV71DRAFT_244653 [Rhizopus microsporus]|uniref:Uncharacterized protein n=1 Tax=Rhizopus microsporus TaxID=58291 RepID=A0A1X0RWW0_RHIZD|nr:hypothetical protein BCV71DRAFT_244653 [Rhizopus microsporus]